MRRTAKREGKNKKQQKTGGKSDQTRRDAFN